MPKTISKSKKAVKTSSVKRKRVAAPKKKGVENCIELRGVRQNNLKGFDLDLPLGKFIVVTGASGSGKSSLAFQTLYAEGQRRYLETFSAYTRQFFERMDKPQVDSIKGIPPAIALEQNNGVRSTRSTVGTITEINDYLKILFARLAKGYCPKTGVEVKPDTVDSILGSLKGWSEEPILVTFPVPLPETSEKKGAALVADLFEFLQAQGYLRVLIFGEVYRCDEPKSYPKKTLPAVVDVIQDRVAISKKKRLSEAIEAALALGKGRVAVVDEKKQRREFSSDWHCPESGITLHPPVSGLFSYNHPLGACPKCRGFGRVIGIDLEKAIPDPSLSIEGRVITAFGGERGEECQQDLLRCAKMEGIDVKLPFEELPKKEQQWVLYGEGDDPEETWKMGRWYGVKGFFDWMESKAYKMHVRVFLSRYRAYTKCGDCRGQRLQPQALCFRVEGKTLPELWQMPVSELLSFIEGLKLPSKKEDRSLHLVHEQILSRLKYMSRVGLAYLDLDRPTRSLSGGELQRVNLTTCLGASLTGTLFVLDEPSIGLHPRDTARLIEILHELRQRGNTLLVVEHEEAIMRAAEHIVEIGPERGAKGGELVYSGEIEGLLSKKGSLTADYLSGRKAIELPAQRRTSKKSIKIRGASVHNLKSLDVDIPLRVLCCLTGVSGSGKSTLVHEVLYRNLLAQRGEDLEEEPARIKSLSGAGQINKVILVDQSTIARTPRSTPAVYLKVFDRIRKIFSKTEMAKDRGLNPGYFSFNSSEGRCERCEGRGYEKVEMQFLSDLYLTCSECEGKRFQDEVMEVKWAGASVSEVLNWSVSEAIEALLEEGGVEGQKAADTLQLLVDLGLGYLRLGQPLNTLSGGESQRLKLVSHLLEISGKKDGEDKRGDLFILDEPTTGLHFDDIKMLLAVFDRLLEAGHSLIVVEHNTEVIKYADHLIDLGPEGGAEGGLIVAEGTPEEVASCAQSHTGLILAEVLAGRDLKLGEAASHYLGRDSSDTGSLVVEGARQNNLKNISLEIPRDQLVVVSGLSGSGKSTLAFDLIFAEGQRRFLDSMSAYARQFVGQLERPDVDQITGLPPTVAIEQRLSRSGVKSTVATVTEIYHFLRLLYAKLGEQYSPDSGKKAVQQTISQILTRTRTALKTSKGGLRLLAPLIRGRKGFHDEVVARVAAKGVEEVLVDGKLLKTEGFARLDRYKEHDVDAVVARLSSKMKAGELREAMETALEMGHGTVKLYSGKKTEVLSQSLSCPETGRSFEELDPRMFSFHSKRGHCPKCRGYGYMPKTLSKPEMYSSVLEAELEEERRNSKVKDEEKVLCDECGGARLNEVARHVKVKGIDIGELVHCSVAEARKKIAGLSFAGGEAIIARDILSEIEQRLSFLEEVGLGYLQLNRSASTLSGGEAQRIRLASQLGSNLSGVLYVLDEPTIGLHPRDNARLLDTLCALRDKGNSLLVVEHDEETMERSDHLIDLGPGAGSGGGEVVAQGSLKELRHDPQSITGSALRTKLDHPLRGERRALPKLKDKEAWIQIEGASANNLKNINVAIPKARLTVISGVSGSGKSSLMRGVIKPAVSHQLAKGRKKKIDKKWEAVTGLEDIVAVYEVDQSPIGKTSRSCPATYIKVFDEIRKLFAATPEARMRGYQAGRFSFNSKGGRCEECGGNGRIKLEMNFLPTTWVPCTVCEGKRYNEATLEVEYHGASIADVMEMTVSEAAEFFERHPKINRTLRLLEQTGTGYLKLGQPSPTVSGGEAQRIKLVTELARGINRSENARLKKGKIEGNLYLIEEPSIGLHRQDVLRLLELLHGLVDAGNTVVVIEHNLDIMSEADYLIDIGPEAGEQGGKVVVAGTPEKVAANKRSVTASHLSDLLN